jgi:uncharacterized RDD family membrane protein YckC
MRTIEISTTQNVTIEYDLATIGERILAFIIDFFIIWVSITLLSIVVELSFSITTTQYLYYLIILPVFLFYSLLSDIFGNGRSWGKRALGIKVVKITGTEASISDYMIRWAFRMIDIYFSIGSLGLLLISSTNKSQRLGDVVANTAVIKVRPRTVLRLADLMKIKSRQDYEPRYPEVKQMTESDMVTVKAVIERFKEYPNQAHREVMDELVNTLRDRLQIREQIQDPQNFLKTLINDYIVLTR